MLTNFFYPTGFTCFWTMLAINLCNWFLLLTFWEQLTRAWVALEESNSGTSCLALVVTRIQRFTTFLKPSNNSSPGSQRIIHFLENQLMKRIILIGDGITLSCFVGIYVFMFWSDMGWVTNRIRRKPERYLNINLHGWYDNRDVLFR